MEIFPILGLQKFICGTDTDDITCSSTPCTTINITYANYGHTSLEECYDNYPIRKLLDFDEHDCSSTDSTAIVRERCQGNVACTLEADTTVFGETCSGNSMYLEVQYDCISSPGKKRKPFCGVRPGPPEPGCTATEDG